MFHRQGPVIGYTDIGIILNQMISKALILILSQLNQYIEPVAGAEEAVLGNIALNEAPDQNALKNKVVISLVNVEEESTMKNTINHQKLGSLVSYREPAVNVNLYLLLSAHYPQDYDTALKRLSDVIRFFQHRKKFSINSATPLPDALDPASPDDMELYLTSELYTMTFEQINHLWGSLGGKQMPFVMYKLRLVMIRDRKVFGEGSIIEEVQNGFRPNVENS